MIRLSSVGLAFAALFWGIQPALAQIEAVPAVPLDRPTLPSDEVSGRAAIDPATCVRLTRHVPDADVEYRPGADDVVPADIEPMAPVEVPKDFSLYVGVDTASRIQIPSDPGLWKGYVDVGRIDWRGGRLFFNGRPLTAAESEQVMLLCREALGR